MQMDQLPIKMYVLVIFTKNFGAFHFSHVTDTRTAAHYIRLITSAMDKWFNFPPAKCRDYELLLTLRFITAQIIEKMV